MRKSLRQVQEDIEVPNAHISQLENNKIKKPSVELLSKLAIYYECNLDDLLTMAGYEDDEKNSQQKRKTPPSWHTGIQNIHRMVTATDLINYSGRRESEGKLPEIIRRLITATADIQYLTMPCGDSVNANGWDGKVIFDSHYSHNFIPTGVSFWEMGKGKYYKTKANDDFKKRTENPLGEKINEATFVFVTTQRFDKKSEWLIEKRKEKGWKDVVVHDADDIEHWLEIAPSVGLWLATELGLFPTINALPLLAFWQEWWESTDIPITTDLLLKAIPNPSEDIKNFLSQNTEQRLKVYAAEQDVAIAYLCSVIESIESSAVRLSLWSRSIIVKDLETFRKVSQQGHSLLLIPTFENVPIGSAISNGHKVFIASSQLTDDKNQLAIKRLPIADIESHLQAEGGLAEHAAHRLARSTHGSPCILRRRLTDREAVKLPSWTTPENGSLFVPIMLAGSWDSENDGDREVLEILCGKPYNEVEALAHSFCTLENPPCKKIGTLYILTSQEYVYSYLQDLINPESLKKFKKVAYDALSEIDPRYDMDKENRFAALIEGKKKKFSGALRKGISVSLVLIASQPPANYPGAGDLVESVVCDILKKDRHSWKFWASVSDVLQNLAEASPESFLSSLESLENNQESDIQSIFHQTTSMGGCDYSNILWALECCAWNPQYLSRAINILLFLMDMQDTSSNWVNQPSNSILSILLLWYPQTTVSLEKRFEIVDAIIQRDSEKGWWLLMGLIPPRHGIVSNNAKPNYRAWADSHTNSVTNKELYDGIKMICDRIPQLVDEEKNRWKQVIDKLLEIPFMDVRHQLLDKLLNEDLHYMDKKIRLEIWKELEEEIYKHKEFPDAAWSVGGELLEKMEKLYYHFEPADPYEKYSRIFGGSFRHPACISPNHDYKEQEKMFQALQEDAVNVIMSENGLEGILKLCEAVEYPEILGGTLVTVENIVKNESEIISTHIKSENDKVQKLLSGFIWRRCNEGGIEWLNTFFELSASLNEDERVKLLLWMPFKKVVWEKAEALGKSISEKYWQRVPASAIPWEKEETLFVLEKFLNSDRALAAYCLLCHSSYFYELDTISSETILGALNGILNSSTNSPDWKEAKRKLGHDLDHLLEAIEHREDIDKKELAKIEWAIAPMTSYGKKPKNLVNWINRDPHIFCEIIELTFNAEEKTEDEAELSEQKKHLARRGYDLLYGYSHVPGLSKDGILDSEYLMDWISKVRERCSKLKRIRIADDTIGHILAHSPIDPNDKVFPHSTVRDILETYKSEQMEDGFILGVYNKRGMITKRCFEGGAQEVAFAKQYGEWAQHCERRWTRIGKVLRKIEQGYLYEAKREDIRAEANRHFSE